MKMSFVEPNRGRSSSLEFIEKPCGTVGKINTFRPLCKEMDERAGYSAAFRCRVPGCMNGVEW